MLAIWDGEKKVNTAETSAHGPRTIYVVGKVMEPDSFDPEWRNECAPGIHFFITKEEAIAYT